MEVYYLRLQDRAVPDLDPALHIQWIDFRSTFEKRAERGEEPFFLVADSNSQTFMCDINFEGLSREIHVYIPQIKKWAIFPIVPSVLFADAVKRAVPIKVYLTKYRNGVLGGWRLALLLARKKKSPIYRFRGEDYDLGPAAYNDPTFGDNARLTIALKLEITSDGRKKKRGYRRIFAVDSLPLPTAIPE